MTPPKKPWAWCNRPGCETKLIFARRAGAPADAKRRPYEWEDRAPFSDLAVGCHVIVAGEAFTPRELIEHFQVTSGGMPEDKARELVSGYPWHRPHRCDSTPADTSKDAA
ncbi:hypothetical protein [Nocardioides aquiterrae]|uniref:Uncharacterized protein n=1 Tax=Nocardioides aquiterrae TaxID=203799 RepID=A0ABN1UC57_9ACTN